MRSRSPGPRPAGAGSTWGGLRSRSIKSIVAQDTSLSSPLHSAMRPPGQQELGAGDRGPPVSAAGSAQSHAARPLQELPLSGGQLDHASTDRGESRAPRRRAVPVVRFIVTNLRLPNRAFVRFYNKRGTAEQWIKESRHETQGILTGGEASAVPNDKVTLFLLRTMPGGTRRAAWWPQIRFPDGRYAFAFAV